MSKSIRPVLLIGKITFIAVFAITLALAVSWVAGGAHKASAETNTDVVQLDCPLNENEQPICPIDTTNDCVPNADRDCSKDCQPNANTSCEKDPNSQNTNPDPQPTPQVLGAATASNFKGK